MKGQALGALVLGLVTFFPALAADDDSQIFSSPVLPTAEALDRLHLRMAWNGFVPVDGRRDGLATVQIDETDLFVQTRSGLISRIDAETGRTIWRTRVGLPYQPTRRLGFNSRRVYVANGTYLFGLDRGTGATLWQMSLPAGLSAPPVADEDQVYLCLADGRLNAYRLPPPSAFRERKKTIYDIDPSKRAVLPQDKNLRSTPALTRFTSVRQAGSELNWGPVPVLHWSTSSNLRLNYAPVYSKETVFAASPAETYFGMDKNLDDKYIGAVERYRLKVDGAILAPPAAYDDTAYLGSADANLYAIHMDTEAAGYGGRPKWRFTAGSEILRKPAVTAQDVYVVSRQAGLARVDRNSGAAAWHIPRGSRLLTGNPEADRFVAANPKYVYANDPRGRLLVLERQRGNVLSSFDAQAYVVPVPNDSTDRIYLAANNGLIVCLHDRDYLQPYRHRPLLGRSSDVTVALREALEQPVIQKAGDQPQKIRDLLNDLAKRYGINFDFGNRAFAKEKVEPAGDQMATFPQADNIPLKAVIQMILDQAKPKARFEVIGDTIFVLPPKAKAN